ncbi:unnamed protein product [Rotaria socialis]
MNTKQHQIRPIINNININNLSNLSDFKLEEIDQASANQFSPSLLSTGAYEHSESADANSINNSLVDASVGAITSISNYSGEIFLESNPPELIRRPSAQGPITYRQNISPPVPPPLVIRQRAPPLRTPAPLILRERPLRILVPISSTTIIKRLPPISVTPQSVIVEQPQQRKLVTHHAPPSRPYPTPPNIIITYESIQANVVRSVQKFGVQPQNPDEYRIRYGNTLLDASPLISQALDFGIVEDFSPLSSNYDQQYQLNSSAYYLNNAQTIFEPQYEYGTSSWGSQTANNNEKVEIY